MAVDYDVVIVGGGIQGAGIAQACVAGGYTCLVLEKTAVAAGTSRASSKLIHGGLRYLASAEISLVRECLKERQWLIENAATLVKPMRFYIPLYKGNQYPRWQLMAGLGLYAVLSGLTRYSRFKRIPKEKWDEFKTLKMSGLVGLFQYWDAVTDDQLLTESVMRSAQSLGAELLCPAEFVSAQKNAYDYHVTYRHNGEEKQLTTNMLVNVAGPWVNEVQSAVTPALYTIPVELVQGTHLVLEGQLFSDKVMYLEHPDDQRVVFVTPWYGNTLIGTTERPLSSPADIAVTDEETDYLLTLWAYYFGGDAPKVLECMAGSRVLPASSKSVFKKSREAQILVGKLSVAVYGGKLTGFRAVSKKVVSEVALQLGAREPKADVDKLKLT
ncbi:MAG: FAD-dependent oxidoreductase [Pseudomonadota bacterium]